ncbi:hypothetical protein ABBQ38_003473 [Trebouxia sp. C0009 RCD-2024]
MAQKALFKNKKNPSQKAVAANRHGKIAKTKKGNFAAPPKKASLLKAYADNKALTTAINKRNEKAAVGQAAQAGGRLKSMQPPINGTADQRQKAKSSAVAR